ncbi:hypothetical protein B0H10DRAFT_1949588 [Mycena sp. CBHHK59/15]|nr:hypothetical protein B0H10DRAFT_1949588 [Mycena sp. CBHHK59/15]
MTAGPLSHTLKNLIMVHFGLEGNLQIIPVSDLTEIVRTSIPGPNTDKWKASRLCSFCLPEHFTEPGSQDKVRTINIFAAILMQEHAIIISDFSCMVRMHVISRNYNFLDFNIAIDSVLWRTKMWTHFLSSPDCVKEMPAALDHLEKWWSTMIDSSKQKINQGVTVKPKFTNACILDELTAVDSPTAGIGAHLGNNLLYLLGATVYLFLSQGWPYEKPWMPAEGSYRVVDVLHHTKPKCYTIIKACLPAEWKKTAKHTPFTDISNTGYMTTVGVASFREVLSNKMNTEHTLNTCLHPGRPAKVCTLYCTPTCTQKE